MLEDRSQVIPSQSISSFPTDEDMVSRHSSVELQTLKDMFYRCQFSAVIKRIESGQDLLSANKTHICECRILKATCLYELHRVKDSLSLLRQLAVDHYEYHDSFAYAEARLAYLSDDMQGAERLFRRIVNNTSSSRYLFKAFLGIANVAYTTRSEAKVKQMLSVLDEFEPLPDVDDTLSLELFLANVYHVIMQDFGRARCHLNRALKVSAASGKSYFQLRALFALALVAQTEKRYQELDATLNILKAFIDPKEHVFFSHLVNEKFAQTAHTIRTTLEFDSENKRVFLRGKWLALHDRPTLYRFLEVLHVKDRFVTKKELSMVLWEGEAYKPRVHDPRIFDIAKRVRAMIEAYENQPVILLSSRLGYKLVSQAK